MKTSSTLFRFFKLKSILFGIGFLFSIILIPLASAEIFIPPHEYLGYFDSNGIYTVVGNIKNENDFAVIPTITVSVMNGDEIFSKTIKHFPIGSKEEIPFKLKFFEITENTPVLMPAELSFEKTIKDAIPIEVLYDKTLIKHEDGHLIGRIQNTGEEIIYFPKIYAVVHGYERVLDIVQNIEFIEKIEPGEILEFSMYPDPSITEDVFYYSCFVPGSPLVIPMTAKKDGDEFNFKFDSGAWFSTAEFDATGTTLTITGYNSFLIETYANFEFPPISGDEKFDVTVNDKPIDFIQSIDDMGFWHVAFTVKPTSQSVVKISGFEKGLPPELPKVPQWIKINAHWWTNDQISDKEFLEGIEFLFEREFIIASSKEITAQANWEIPSWYKTTAGWWFEEKITDNDFLYAIENLVTREIIII